MAGFNPTVAKVIATFGGLGYIPKGSGTFGALGAFVIAVCLYNVVNDPALFQIILGSLILISYIAGFFSAATLEPDWGHDDSKIVIDEAMGFWVSILFIPFSWTAWMAAFGLFRFFDILKPMGIRRLDDLHSPHGVMLDDLLAGIYSNIILSIVLKII